ncbi:TolC family outer membrane protein [Jiella sp. MQZ9-1]|uniref:TolC family outer membrane protein n=1 Tax=Jiella flava TaxID=2816857 RepID=A0A939JYI4_9HYPH|nr:TolC family outer membrane protein [Jiella flava]MBO0664446.1 TolC family outer membrane protein [Jiella flava]MCD2473082.1 TolC family outer membrane protein [Jiella flava]
MVLKKLTLLALLSVSVTLGAALPVAAETLSGALAKAYSNNQDLNAARAQLRATDESVPQAKARLRPTVSGVGSLNAVKNGTTFGDGLPSSRSHTYSSSVGIKINQTIFDGFQTPNNIRAAKAQVKAAQFNLINTEQNTLLDAATAYMNVVRDRKIANLRRQNLKFLNEQVRASRARFDVGEGTRTDVAQAESQQALATALLNSALSQVASSEASYFQVVGDAPRNLAPASLPSLQLPRSVSSAFAVSQRQHPAILATLAAVDAASFQVKSAEGAFLPQVSLTGEVSDTYAMDHTEPQSSSLAALGISTTTQNEVSATIGAQVTIPIYQGGLASSQVRQYKETLGQRRIEVDGTRDQVRAAVATSWAQLEAAKANITGYQAQVRAARLALDGVIEERNVGQRTTLDVLNAQADLISAQILLVGSQRDEVVAGYSLLSSVGKLTASSLHLAARKYDPKEHYIQVEDKWFGLRTPDGR